MAKEKEIIIEGRPIKGGYVFEDVGARIPNYAVIKSAHISFPPQLMPLPWWKRLWALIKRLFRFGHKVTWQNGTWYDTPDINQVIKEIIRDKP